MRDTQRRGMRVPTTALAGALGVLLSMVLPSAANAQSASITPTFSATGVCVKGVPEFAFTLSGLPSGQRTVVRLTLFDSPEAGGSAQVSLGPGISTVLWNTSSSALFGSGQHIVEVQVNNVWIPSTNLTLLPTWPIPNSYWVTLPTCGSRPARFVALDPTSDGQGYWQATSDGQVLGFGDASYFGSRSGMPLNKPIVTMAPTPDGKGYWLVAADGGVFAFGDASFFGSVARLRLIAPAVGMAPTPDGKGYWLVAADGGVFAFGDASFFGSVARLRLIAPAVGMAPTPDGKGYWLVGADGGVFALGDAGFHGSLGGMRIAHPVVGITPTPDSGGYWMAGSDGGLFALGDAEYLNSLPGSGVRVNNIVALAHTGEGDGYWMAGADGGVFAFGDASFLGTIVGAPTDTG